MDKYLKPPFAKPPFRLSQFLCFSTFLKGKDGSGSGFGSWKTVPAVPVPLSVSGKNGSDGSGSRFRFGSGATLKENVEMLEILPANPFLGT